MAEPLFCTVSPIKGCLTFYVRDEEQILFGRTRVQPRVTGEPKWNKALGSSVKMVLLAVVCQARALSPPQWGWACTPPLQEPACLCLGQFVALKGQSAGE